MFFPISWMSPKTVAIAMVPFSSCSFPEAARVSFILRNELPTVSALSKSCGRNFFPVSKSFPTLSRAGTMQLSIIFTGAFFSRSLAVASAALSLKPFSIICISSFSSAFFSAPIVSVKVFFFSVSFLGDAMGVPFIWMEIVPSLTASERIFCRAFSVVGSRVPV